MSDDVLPISDEEAVRRIRAGLHVDAASREHLVDEILVSMIRAGAIRAGIRESDGRLVFTRARDD